MAHTRVHPTLLFAAAALLVSGLACSALSSLGSQAEATATPPPTRTRAAQPTDAPEPTETPEPEPTEEPPTAEPTAEPLPTLSFNDPPTGEVLFEDGFDDNTHEWDEDSSDTAAREFRDGVYSLQVFNSVWFAWANPITEDFQNAHIQVTVSNVGGNDPAFGVLCAYQDTETFYFLGFGDDGYYGIGRIEGGDFALLTGDGESWALSNDIELFQDAYTLEAECRADGTLRLVVDGVEIAEVQDESPYAGGGVGVFVQTFDNVPVDVEFDDMVVTQLEE